MPGKPTAESGKPGPEDTAERYAATVDLRNRNDSHTQLVLRTPPDSTVLEVGPAGGSVTRVLRERGCRVTAIEIDERAAAAAAPFCERMIVGNIEDLDLGAVLGSGRFDVVLFGDVLEHLVDPGRTLRATRGILREAGRVIASIPNVAHADVRLSLLLGRFPYRDEGLLDRTHLRFFTRASLERLFQEAGFGIDDLDRVTLEPFGTNLGVAPDEVPTLLAEAVRDAPEARTFQFIVEARPSDAPGVAPSDEGTALQLLRDLPDPDVELTSRLDEARRELELLRARILEKDAAIAELQQLAQRATDDLEALASRRSVRTALAASRLLRRRSR